MLKMPENRNNNLLLYGEHATTLFKDMHYPENLGNQFRSKIIFLKIRYNSRIYKNTYLSLLSYTFTAERVNYIVLVKGHCTSNSTRYRTVILS